MKKATVILILVIQVALLFIFQNVYSLLKSYEKVGEVDKALWAQNLGKLLGIFSALTIITGLVFLGTGGYLVYLFSRAKTREKEKGGHEAIPPLQAYLMQLKNQETELKSMAETQEENAAIKDELNKSIVNNIDAAIVFLTPVGRVEIFNPTAQAIFSRSFASAKNNLYGKVLEAFPEVAAFVAEHINERTTADVVCGDRIFRIHLVPIEKAGVLVIAWDITEEKRREEIDRRNGNFIMLGEMTAFLAHEVKNALGVIYGYAKTIKSEKEKTSKINREILFLTDMMEGFLNFAKPVTVNKKESMDLLPMLRTIAGEQNLTLEEPGEALVFEMDESLIHSIFSNLLLNSREAGADTVTITTVSCPESGRLEIRLTDNGSGIPSGIREKNLVSFFTTKDKGTGMGLASIRKIINSLGGEISFEGSGAGGTTFKIVFYPTAMSG